MEDPVIRKSFPDNGAPLLTAELTLPRFNGDAPAERELHRFYEALSRDLMRLCERTAKILKKHGFRPDSPGMPVRLRCECRVTFRAGGLVSVLRTVQLDGPGGRRTVRDSDNWRGDRLARAQDFFSGKHWRRAMRGAIRAEAENQRRCGLRTWTSAQVREAARQAEHGAFFREGGALVILSSPPLRLQTENLCASS